MDTLPLETLQRIFELACTDGGRTGNSLSLVSKGIRAAARTTRFHSIALIASPRRLQSFIDLYGRECDPARGDRPRIEHLHVAFPYIELGAIVHVVRGADMHWPLAHTRSLEPFPSPLAQSTLKTAVPARGADQGTARTSTARTLPPALQHDAVRPNIWRRTLLAIRRYRTVAMESLTGHRRTSCSDHQTTSGPEHLGPSTYEEYRDAAQTLFRLVAFDLVTLVVQYGFTFGGEMRLPIVDRPFPHLLEAAFVGVADPRALLSRADSEADSPIFPALTHLYIAVAYAGAHGLCLPFWTAHAPGVTHMSVSCAENYLNDISSAVGLRMPSEHRADLLPQGLDGDADEEDEDAPSLPTSTPMYPSVRHLVLQPGPEPKEAWCGNVWINYDAKMRALRWVGRSCETIGVEAFQAEAPVDGTFLNYYERARSAWLARIGDSRDEVGGWRG